MGDGDRETALWDGEARACRCRRIAKRGLENPKEELVTRECLDNGRDTSLILRQYVLYL